MRSAGTGAAAANEQGVSEGIQQVILGGDGEVVPVKFELVPNEVGRRTLRLKVRPPSEDRYQGDDQQEVDIEVVDRKTKACCSRAVPRPSTNSCATNCGATKT